MCEKIIISKKCVFVYAGCKGEFIPSNHLVCLCSNSSQHYQKHLTLFGLFAQQSANLKHPFEKGFSSLRYKPKELLTILHLRMYWVMWTDEGGFHWMGWESGCFPASVMITWTGLWPSDGKRLRRRHRERVGETWTKLLLAVRKHSHIVKDV